MKGVIDKCKEVSVCGLSVSFVHYFSKVANNNRIKLSRATA